MSPERLEHVRHRLDRAREALDLGRVALERGYLQEAVSRLYYACFHAVSALLFSEGRSARKHKGIVSLFDQYWIKPQRLPSQMSRFYHALLKTRIEADYEDFVPLDKSQIEGWVEEATALIGEIERQIEAQAKDSNGA